jgi:LmbE family N-acetylglucosaminyl deacetylase
MANRRLLLIFPHPDDETYGCGGTILKYVAEGAEVSLLTLTKGEASSQGAALGLTTAQMGEKRAEEMYRLRDHYGLSELVLLDFPDGKLADLDPRTLEEAVARTIIRLQPQVVVSYPPHGVSGFIDHLISHAVVKRVFAELRDSVPALQRFAMQTVDRETAAAAPRALRFDTDEAIDCRIDGSAYREGKRIALEIQQSISAVIASDNTSGILLRPYEHYCFWQEQFSPWVDDLFFGLDTSR